MKKERKHRKWLDRSTLGKASRNVIMLITSVATLLVSVFICVIYVSNLEMEKYRQTFQLCEKFNSMYRYYDKSDTMIIDFKIWDKTPLTTIDSACCDVKNRINKWDNLSYEDKIIRLKSNIKLQQILGFFEDAKLLHRKKLLDREYFDNYFTMEIKRLQAADPSIENYINAVKTREDIWDGYRYCCDNILTELIEIPDVADSVKIVKIYKKRNRQRVKKLEPIVKIRFADGRDTVLSANRDGKVYRVKVKKGNKYPGKTIVMEIIPKNEKFGII